MTRLDPEQPPENLTAWLAAGWRRPEAQAWRRWNFTLDQAREWRESGVAEALTAAQWQAAGVEPRAVGDWVAARITSAEAVRWHEFGYDLEQAREHAKQGRGPDEAYQQETIARRFTGGSRQPRMAAARSGERIQAFLKAGVQHDVVRGYLSADWLDDTALAWAEQGIQVWDARIWKSLGLTPAEAAELQQAEVTPMRAVEEWWRAGIPFDEVADWLGAGLTAAEAAEQRAAGVTVEQAAALRALRRGGAL
ncbi:hypothetical protein [Amycolatopsis anabasis]|uniref:hypothetical protein n=1 Tax=Amycolatopsis anabasis TaxID=1840409 RepID=UPI00131BE0C1|nr:hypothetical protein [Amycolatopsis anabasis]